MISRLSLARRHAGFSLLELAIVLGIMGVVMGAIWSARNIVLEKERVDSAVVSVREMSENVRSLYRGFSNITYPTDVTAQICAGIFAKGFLVQDDPRPQFCHNWTVTNPWNGNVRVQFYPVSSLSFPHGFGIALTGPLGNTLPTNICVEMVQRLPGTDMRAAPGVDSSNNVPKPIILSAFEPSQAGQPSNVYVSSSVGTWIDVTHKGPAWITQQLPNGCFGVGFFFEY